MKTIGLIGGLSWKSTAEYFRIINEEVKMRLGGFHSAKLVLYSVDFFEIEEMQRENRWEEAARILSAAGRNVASAGADFALICANTMHKVFDEVQGELPIPLLHIVDAAAASIKNARLKTVALLGTKFTMEGNFYIGRLSEKHGLAVIVPEKDDRDALHRILYEELCLGTIQPESKKLLNSMIGRLQQRGAEGAILGCTELPMLIHQHSSLPLFDTTALHARAASELALKD